MEPDEKIGASLLLTAGESLGRDVFNERLGSAADLVSGVKGVTSSEGKVLPDKAVINTSMGEIHLDLFPSDCPKTVENFITHARNGYYDSCIFHRVIRSFMIQTGDP